MSTRTARRFMHMLTAVAIVTSGLLFNPAPAQAAPIFKLPLECGNTGGSYVGSTYPGHGGNGLAVDFNQGGDADYGDEVLASTAGYVSDMSQVGINGQITIDHGGGWTTVYAHMSSVQVSPGEPIEVGELLGFVHHTGLAPDQVHLHYQQILNGVTQHPTFDGAAYSFNTPISSTLCLSPPFTDHFDSPYRNDINWLHANGVTTGCDTIRFCPTDQVTRGVMAAFVARYLNLPATTTNYFSDDNGYPHEGDINRLAAAGITFGCGGGMYCPHTLLARAPAASFVVRGLVGLPPVTQDWFTDDNGNPHESDINKLRQAGITTGCGGTSYCPSTVITREQVAAFLHRAAPYRP